MINIVKTVVFTEDLKNDQYCQNWSLLKIWKMINIVKTVVFTEDLKNGQ